jgi:hypothetical protein
MKIPDPEEVKQLEAAREKYTKNSVIEDIIYCIRTGKLCGRSYFYVEKLSKSSKEEIVKLFKDAGWQVKIRRTLNRGTYYVTWKNLK